MPSSNEVNAFQGLELESNNQETGVQMSPLLLSGSGQVLILDIKLGGTLRVYFVYAPA